MTKRDVEFFSQGIRLEGYLVTPDGATPEGGRPTVIILSGLNGVKEWVPPRWYPLMVEAGLNVFTFDYRGFGTSDGERGRLIPEEEVQDALSALDFVVQQPEVAADRVGVLGWGLGGGIAVAAAARDERLRAVAAAATYAWGERVERDMTWLAKFMDLKRQIAQDRLDRVITGNSRLLSVDALRALDAHASGRQYVKDVADIGVTTVDAFTLESIEAQLNFRPEAVVDQISPRPLMVIHGADDDYTSVDEAISLHAHAREPKELVIIQGGGHLEWILPESELHRPNVGRVVEWFVGSL